MSRVFVSHSHADKSIARRIVRFLVAYGVDAWLDERELRIGSRLDDAICAAIHESDTVVVVGTRSAAESVWVEREVSLAVNSIPPIPVVPVYVEDVTAHPSFARHLGVCAMDRHRFSEALTQLAEAFVGSPLPPPDAAQLEAGLKALARENSKIELLVNSCLHGEGLRYEYVELVSKTAFHDLDDALDAICHLGGGREAAFATAAMFSRTGTGSSALRSYIDAGHDGVLRTAVGDLLDPTHIDAALRLLAETHSPDDQALASFIWKNAESLTTDHYHEEVVRLVTHPVRGPEGFGADAAAAAFDLLPDADELVILWDGWIRKGLFDSQKLKGAAGPQCLAHWCSRGVRAGSNGWRRVFDHLLGHVRSLVRAKSKEKVHQALDTLAEAADADHLGVSDLARTCEAAIGAAEWDGWEHRGEMSAYVREYTREALGKRDWGEAFRRATEAHERRVKLERAIAARKRSKGGGPH
jgi:TIR domain-containing protein